MGATFCPHFNFIPFGSEITMFGFLSFLLQLTSPFLLQIPIEFK